MFNLKGLIYLKKTKYFLACGCFVIGSRGVSCDQTDGTCKCRDNFQGDKCDECVPDRYSLTSQYLKRNLTLNFKVLNISTYE